MILKNKFNMKEILLQLLKNNYKIKQIKKETTMSIYCKILKIMINKKKFKFKYLNKIFKKKVLIYLNYNNNSRNF